MAFVAMILGKRKFLTHLHASLGWFVAMYCTIKVSDCDMWQRPEFPHRNQTLWINLNSFEHHLKDGEVDVEMVK